jgi:GNAT superfamily N-acetyltransferase
MNMAHDLDRRLDGLGLAVHRPGMSVVDEVRCFRGGTIRDRVAPSILRHAKDGVSDPHPADFVAYHVVLRTTAQQSLVACLALAPLESLPTSGVRSWSPALSDRLLSRYRFGESSVLEGARLVVAASWRGRGLGVLMMLGAFALGEMIGRPVVWGTSGTRYRQHHVPLAVGMQVREEFGRRYVPQLADTLCVVAGSSQAVPTTMTSTVTRLRSILEVQGEAA